VRLGLAQRHPGGGAGERGGQLWRHERELVRPGSDGVSL
jgi:hypothetical protein